MDFEQEQFFFSLSSSFNSSLFFNFPISGRTRTKHEKQNTENVK